MGSTSLVTKTDYKHCLAMISLGLSFSYISNPKKSLLWFIGFHFLFLKLNYYFLIIYFTSFRLKSSKENTEYMERKF